MRIEAVSLTQFATTLYKRARSDRYNLIFVSGVMGSGKSCFMDKLARAYAKVSNTKYTVNDNMTWARTELNDWIDGNEDDPSTQKPEYAAIVADELISMLNRRNWYKAGQKGIIELLNKCRDRHLLILGAVPVFQHLDGMVKGIADLWIHIDKRGNARVYKQEENEFNSDPWNTDENKKLLRKKGVPYQSYNFVCVIRFEDWTEQQKAEYYKIRNEKRKNTENQDEKNDKAHDSVKQRNNLIQYLANSNRSAAVISEVSGLGLRSVQRIIRGNK